MIIESSESNVSGRENFFKEVDEFVNYIISDKGVNW
jgi:hypothetical protein